MRLDAALYEPVPERPSGQTGRPRLKGKHLPTLQKILQTPTTSGTTVTIAKWDHEPERAVEVCSATAVWYHTGMPPVPIRWVLIRDTQNKVRPQALLSTDLTVSPSQIVTAFVHRWQVEVTFQEVRMHLGSKPNGSGRIWRLSAQLPLCWGCSPSSPCSHSLCRLIGPCLLDRQRGTPRLRPPLLMPWLSFARICGGMRIFPCLRKSTTSYKSHGPFSSAGPTRSVTPRDWIKSSSALRRANRNTSFSPKYRRYQSA